MADQRRAFGLRILNASHSDNVRLKREGNVAEIHGNRFWNSSFLIMDYLRRHPLKKRARVLEVGCGWGLLGMYCAAKFDAKVCGSDADRAVGAYLDLHAELNGVRMKFEKKRFSQLTVDYLSQFDVLLGADICFWDELTPELFNMIRRAKRAGVRKVMIADPCRSPFEDLSGRCDQAFDSVKRIEKWLKKPVRASGEILIVDLN